MRINNLSFIFIAISQLQQCASFLNFKPLSIYNGHLPMRLSANKVNTVKPEVKEPSFKDELGVIKPLGFWDPLKITNNMDQRLFNYVREAELQHGRIAMLSMAVLPTLDILDKNELSINAYQNNQDITLSMVALMIMGLYESSRIFIQYENPSTKLFRLKENVMPGNLFNYNTTSLSPDLLNKEISNGRLAMVGALTYIIQELVTQQKIF